MLERMTISTGNAVRSRRLRDRGGLLMIVWGMGTGLLSVYWATGGTVGLDQLGVRIQEQATARESSFMAMIWLSAVARLAYAALGMALAQPWGEILPRRVLLTLGWLGGGGLALYGLAGIAQAALVMAGFIDTPVSMGDAAVPWYLLLWEPLWLIGGIAGLIATLGFQRSTR